MNRRAASGLLSRILCGAILQCAFFGGVLAVQTSARQATTSTNPCPRFQPGSDVTQPPDLFSHGGVLEVDLNYYTTVDPNIPLDQAPTPLPPPFATGLQQFCFTTPDGKEQPTLHVWPGDSLVIHVKNNAPDSLVFEADQTIDYNQAPGENNTAMVGIAPDSPCLASNLTPASTNIYFHGMNIANKCGQNDVLRTIINSGQRFTYNVEIPEDQPPGLYWYHPHVHGTTDGTNQGGASGALIVEGIQSLQPAVAGLSAQTLVVRDQPVPGGPFPLIGSEVPSWDLTINYVTISSCQDPQPCNPNQFVGDFKPAVLRMKPGEKQFWRVVDATNHIPLHLQLLYDGVPQPFEIVALDGVPVNSGDGAEEGRTITRTDILLEPSARAEIIIKGPSESVKNAVFQTLRVSTGPGGDNHPQRPLFTIQTSDDAPESPVTIPGVSNPQDPPRFVDLADVNPRATRNLYFSEVLQDPNNPLGPTNFFLTPVGGTETLFTIDTPPAIVTTQGSVEDWTIENHAMEDHAFHIHNLHFLLLAINGAPVPRDQQQYLDVVDLSFWDGVSPYPNVTVRMDFRGADIGDLIYECNYLFHADFGMRGIIRVLP
jgi:FtsP/CotA-like multicopper oxidase with cupredoxin domain